MSHQSEDEVYGRTLIRICQFFNIMAAVLLFFLMMLGSADVIGRYLLNAPIIGTMERGQILLALIVFFSWGYTQMKKGHVRVELFINHFPARTRMVTELVTTSLTLLFFILIVWQSTIMAIETHKTGEVAYVIHWPMAPFQLMVPVGGIFVCLVLIMEMIQIIRRLRGGAS
ncbi:MAG: TRAP transporter small permease [Deltaproteobacteria bacterium]|nr:TRAP transporter small permease [Deltaproteobacteria bacterium]